MGEAPTLPAAVMLARHIAECPSLLPEVSQVMMPWNLSLLFVQYLRIMWKKM